MTSVMRVFSTVVHHILYTRVSVRMQTWAQVDAVVVVELLGLRLSLQGQAVSDGCGAGQLVLQLLDVEVQLLHLLLIRDEPSPKGPPPWLVGTPSPAAACVMTATETGCLMAAPVLGEVPTAAVPMPAVSGNGMTAALLVAFTAMALVMMSVHDDFSF